MQKMYVLNRVANGQYLSKISGLGRSKWRIGTQVVHVRYRSNPVSKTGNNYSFNINPNTLQSDYEIWICGDTGTYYLIPIGLIQEIYRHPDAYVDYTHPDIRVVDVNIDTDQCRYARGADTLDFASFRCVVLAN